MEEKDKEYFRQILTEEREKAERLIRNLKMVGTPEQSEHQPAELSNYDNHPAELGSELYQAELNNALLLNEEERLKEIKEALNRIEKNRFGICTLCGREIDTERLKAIPYTDLCVNCAEKRSRINQALREQKRLTENELYEKRFLNAWDDTRFEGLDQLNDLIKYGSSDTPQDFSQNRDMKNFYTNKDDKQGTVDHMDRLSNEQYQRQLPD